jgi:DNA primase
MKGAANDPIEKARLVNDIVRSIAIVPDAITRSIYIQDCSRLMDVQEEVLYAQVRKIIHKQTEELQKKNYRDSNYQPRPEPDFSTDSRDTVTPRPVTIPKQYTCEIEEREIIRIMLRYFNEEVFEVQDEDGNPFAITVGRYVLEELDNDGLVSDNELINQILNLFAENLENPDFKPQVFFIRNSNPLVSQLATDLLADKYIESKRWKKGGAFVEEEHEILDLLVPKIVQEYKLSKIRHMLRGLESQIQEAGKTENWEDLMKHQNQYINLKKVAKHLSEQLGNRTIL